MQDNLDSDGMTRHGSNHICCRHNANSLTAGKFQETERERENQLTCLKREALMVHGRNYIKTKSNTIMAKQHCDREAALRQAGAGWQTAGRGENESP